MGELKGGGLKIFNEMIRTDDDSVSSSQCETNTSHLHTSKHNVRIRSTSGRSKSPRHKQGCCSVDSTRLSHPTHTSVKAVWLQQQSNWDPTPPTYKQTSTLGYVQTKFRQELRFFPAFLHRRYQSRMILAYVTSRLFNSPIAWVATSCPAGVSPNTCTQN